SDGRFELVQTFADVRPEMYPKRASSALSQHLEITARLGGFDDAERVFLPRHRQINRVVTCDLQKHAGVRPAFVGLAGGVKEPRAKADARGHVIRIAHASAERLQDRRMALVHLDVRNQRKIIARVQTLEMSRGEARQRPIGTGELLERCDVPIVGKESNVTVLEERPLLGKMTLTLVFFGQ